MTDSPRPWQPGEPLWVFGYGSLLWDPGFEVAEAVIARAGGFARSFCMRSIHHRGSVENPGLVLALDAQAGAYCDGLALRVAPGTEAATLDYLRERELISSAYLEVTIPVSFPHQAQRPCVTFIIDRDHVQYCAGLSLEDQAQIIAQAVGGRGPNHEYLTNTVLHLTELGIRDAELEQLSARVATLRA